MQLLVTGGAGFIGSHLIERLVRDGFAVRVLDNLSTGRLENLAPVLREVELLEGDIRDKDTVSRAVRGVDTVFHLAALGSVPRSVANPGETNWTNVEGTLNVLVAARDSGVRRLIYSSSSSVYGDTPSLPKHEELATLPVSPYGVSKLAAELYCRVFWQAYGMETIALRYFNVFGPRQDARSQYAAVIPQFLSRIQRHQSPIIYGDGMQSRDFTYVENVVAANLLATEATSGFGEAFNIAAGGQVTVVDLARRLVDLVGSTVRITYTKSRPGDIRHSFAAIERAKYILGYRPVVGLDEGLQRTVAWYCNEGEAGDGAKAKSLAGRL